MINKILLAGIASIALVCASINANADDWYVAANDGTCINAKLLATATNGIGWASPYIMANGLRAAGVNVNLETKSIGQYLIIFVEIGAVPDEPSLNHANLVYFNNKKICLKIEENVH